MGGGKLLQDNNILNVLKNYEDYISVVQILCNNSSNTMNLIYHNTW